MKVQVQRSGSVVVLDLEGRLTFDEDSDHFHEIVDEVTELEPGNVVLNFEKVRRLDCSGIGQLVQLRKRINDSGSFFTMVNIEPRQRKLLKLVGLLSVFETPVQREELLPRYAGTVRGPRLASTRSVRPTRAVAGAASPGLRRSDEDVQQRRTELLHPVV